MKGLCAVPGGNMRWAEQSRPLLVLSYCPDSTHRMRCNDQQHRVRPPVHREHVGASQHCSNCRGYSVVLFRNFRAFAMGTAHVPHSDQSDNMGGI